MRRTSSPGPRCRVLALLALLAFAGVACGPRLTAFPPGVAPEPAAQVAWPADEAQGLAITHGEDEEGVAWVQARVVVEAPIEAVAEALRQPEMTVDARITDEWSIEWGVEPEYAFSARVKQVMHRLLTVEFFVNWRHAMRHDASGQLVEYAAVYQKTEGTPFVDIMRGSIRAHRLADDTTGVEMVAHLRAYESSPGKLAWSIEGMHETLLALLAAQQDASTAAGAADVDD